MNKRTNGVFCPLLFGFDDGVKRQVIAREVFEWQSKLLKDSLVEK